MGQEAEVPGGPVDDGQHRTGYDQTNLHISREGLQIIYDHMLVCEKVERPLRKDTMIPLSFTSDREKPGILTIYCPLCKQELGTCSGYPEEDVRAKKTR